CWRDPRAYNCGKCEKCLRTMIMLELNGHLERCATLPTELNLDDVESTRLLRRGVVRWRRLQKEAESAGRRDVARAIHQARVRSQVRIHILESAATVKRLGRRVRTLASLGWSRRQP